MRVRVLLAAVITTLMTSSLAFGHQTQGNDPGNTAVKCGKNITTIGTHPNAVYVDLRDIGNKTTAPVTGHTGHYAYNLWLYVESNNHVGLQTKADSPHPVIGNVDESAVENCSTALTGHTSVTTPDTFIF